MATIIVRETKKFVHTIDVDCTDEQAKEIVSDLTANADILNSFDDVVQEIEDYGYTVSDADHDEYPFHELSFEKED